MERPQIHSVDPFLGRTIGERYEIRSLVGIGGMGRVYRAVHRLLDRTVAIKFINRELLNSADIVSRFMTEAKAASRLNHPNVVRIYDFGCTTTSQGGDLYCVMEFLSGPSLSRILKDGTMPLPRIVDILCQVLAALAEAHHEGITHRDVKPANVILEPRPLWGDQVKVIDFGVARFGASTKITRAGEVVGTPSYMAPEQARGEPVGQAADLYAVGVMLFQMLTGRLPFEGGTREAVILQYLTAPRPNPREIAPERDIPEALADVCIRAMDPDPARRWATAEELARAIVEGSGQTWGTADSMLFPVRTRALPSTPPEAAWESVEPAPVLPPATVTEDSAPTVPQPAASRQTRPFLGRTEDLVWALDLLSKPRERPALALQGPAGFGRSRLLEEVVLQAEQDGTRVLRVAADPAPWGEVTFSGLRALITVLIGPEALEAALENQGLADLEIFGMCQIFTPEKVEVGALPWQKREGPVAALSWALGQAASGAAGAPLILAVDDVDRFDVCSQRAFAALVSANPVPGLAVVVTSEDRAGPWFAPRIQVRGIGGLTPEQALSWCGRDAQAVLAQKEGEIEPLYLELLQRWGFDPAVSLDFPTRLAELVLRRLQETSAPERHVLQAMAVLGSSSFDVLAAVAGPEDLETLPGLTQAGFLTVRESAVALRHEIYGRVVVALSPREAIVELHTRAAAALSGTRFAVELCAYHALRGGPDPHVLELVEASADLRLRCGDQDGGVLLLWNGLCAARASVLGGDAEAIDAWVAFGRKLAAALLDAERPDEAFGVLKEILDAMAPSSSDRDQIHALLEKVTERREAAVESQKAPTPRRRR